MNKKNVILFLTDDQGYGDIEYNGNKYLETPNLNKLSSRGVRFDNFHAAPVCAPSRASLLTGKDFLKTGVWDVHGGFDFINLEEKLLPQYLKENGYKTGMFGKWHSGKTSGYLPNDRGFDESYMASLYVHKNNVMSHNGQEVKTKGWTTDVLCDYAMEFINNCTHKNLPFFAYIPFLAPHEPWEAPKQYVEKYENKGLSKSLSTIYGMVEHVDYNVGRIIKFLEKNKILDDTLLIYLSDNGPIGFSSNGLKPLTDGEMNIRNPRNLRGTKGTVYDNGTLVPCVIYKENEFLHMTVKNTFYITDIFLTILNFCNIQLSNENKLDGVSLIPYMSGKKEANKNRLIYNAKHSFVYTDHFMPYKNKNELIFEKQNEKISVRNERFKLVTFSAEKKEAKLFDMHSDPTENKDVKHLYRNKFDYLYTSLKDWFNDLVLSGKSHSIPIFLIGYDEDISYVPLYGPKKVTGNVIPMSHYSVGWKNDGDSQTILIKVVEKGNYNCLFKVKHLHKKAYIEVCIGEKIISRHMESKEVSFGVFKLEKGEYELKLEIVETTSDNIEVFGFEGTDEAIHNNSGFYFKKI